MANPLKRVIRDFTLAIDGVPFNGDCDTVGLPEITKSMEEYRGGGMLGPVELSMGYEMIDLEFELTANDPSVVGLIAQDNSTPHQFVVYTYMQGFGGEEEGSKVECRGEVKQLGRRNLEMNGKVKITFAVAVAWYKETQNGVLVMEYDPLGTRMVTPRGDIMQNRRNLLGL